MAERANIDDTILRYADSMSPEEISLLLGGIVSPATIAARTQSLLQAKDWLTEAQEDQLITLRMKQLVNDISTSPQYRDYKYMDILLRTLQVLSERIDKRRSATAIDLNTLYGNQGQIMMKAFDLALAHMRGRFADQIQVEAWDSEVREALIYAQAELSKHEAIEA